MVGGQDGEYSTSVHGLLGFRVRGLFLIETEKALNIHAVRARLVGKESTRAQGHSDAFSYRESATEICGPQAIQGSFSREFELPIQITGPPSARGEHFEIDWFVAAKLDVPWAANPSIRAPIFIAEADKKRMSMS